MVRKLYKNYSLSRTIGRELVPSPLSGSSISVSTPSVTSPSDSGAGPVAAGSVGSTFPFSTMGSCDDLSLGFFRNRGTASFGFDFVLALVILTSSESESDSLSSRASSRYNSGNGKLSR